MGRSLGALALAAVAAIAALALTGSGAPPDVHACGEAGPFEFDTYEAYDNVALYTTAIELAASGQAITFPTSPLGEPHGLEYPGLRVGPRDARLDEDPAVLVPPTLVKAIAWVEASWANAHHDVPWGGVGPVLRSFDCGFGLGQITTGMTNEHGNATVKQAMVGTHFLFNVAEGVRILADKWNSDTRPIAGTGDPAALEDWYYAIWGYNGFAAVNHPLFDTDHEFEWIDHPLNPWRDPLRGDVYHCADETAPTWIDSGDGTPLYGYGDYTYPERVYGCMRHPPEIPARLIEKDPLASPTVPPSVTGTPTGSEDPTATPEAPATETPSVTTEPSATADPSVTAEPSETVEPSPTPDPDAVPRMWAPVIFSMPDLTNPAVAGAFAPQAFIACQEDHFADGCPAMDFPTSFPELGIEPHTDPTPLIDAAAILDLIGSPRLVITGPSEVALEVFSDGSASIAEVFAENVGTWIAPFRVRRTEPWIVVRRPEGDDHIHGAVAIGAETTVVLVKEMDGEPAVTQQGFINALVITLDPETLPEGEFTGVVIIEPLLGGGGITRITVHGANGEIDPFPYRVVMPGATSNP